MDLERFAFGKLRFAVDDNLITLNGLPFTEIAVCGRNCPVKSGTKIACSSESRSLKYVERKTTENELIVVQQNEACRTETHFVKYADDSAYSVETFVKNVSEKEITLENVSFLYGLGESVEDSDKIYFTRFIQSHHAECQPRRASLFDYGLSGLASVSQIRVSHANVGSWSTKEELPQGILELNGKGCIAFQIESNNAWYYEISDVDKKLYLCADGGNATFNGWRKTLSSGESYGADKVVLAFGSDLNGTLSALTGYRREIAGKCLADDDLPVIFNEYMHFSWDSPNQTRTRLSAERVAKLGVKYYVIDCGWHDEVDGNIIYPYVGKWKESAVRFPDGLRKTTDYIRSLGMKAGLWIEPEIVGRKCDEMINYYGDECFLHRNGEKILVRDRYFLDFKKEKVIDYLTKTIERMADDYGADYIKLDYNEDAGVGADCETGGYCEGIKENSAAYLKWIDGLKKAFPNVLFETCSSGGMRMDYKTLSKFSIVSSSDQVNYKKYPYIASNVFSAVLPEQAAVWSYPVVDDEKQVGEQYEPTKAFVEQNISTERVVMNMVNALLGRIHLASRVWLLPDDRLIFVKEGLDYYNSLSKIKKTAEPYFPTGFSKYGDEHIASGLKAGNKIYLAVWNLGGAFEFFIPIKEKIKSVSTGYPAKKSLRYERNENGVTVFFTEKYQARIIELTV